MANSTLAALAAAAALTGAEIVYGVQDGGDVKIKTQDIANLAFTGTQLSSLPAASALGGPELFYGVQSVTDVKVTATQIKTFVVGAGSVSVVSGKTITVSNTLILAGTDGSTLNVGSGGTLASGAFASAYSLPIASTSTLGGVRVDGSTITISGGVISATGGGGGSPGGSSGQVQYNSSSAFAGANIWISANNVSFANTTAAQAINVYNTTDNNTSPTDYDVAVFDFTTTANILTIGTKKGGTGTLRAVQFLSNGSYSWSNNTRNIMSYVGGGGTGTLTVGEGASGLNNGRVDLISSDFGVAGMRIDSADGIISRSDGSIIWTSGNATGTRDTSMSRSAAGVIAFGNGTQGDASATFKAKTKAGAPSTSDVPAGTYALIHDTTNNTTKVYYNNAGVLEVAVLA